MFRHIAIASSVLLCALSVHAQSEVVNEKADPLQLKPLPTGVILVPGAVPSASDSRTALPEQGKIVRSVYSNRYFGLTYAFPENWIQEFDGPPPSDSGAYVLAEIAPSKSFQGTRGSMLISAQDLFFSLTPPKNAIEYVHYSYAHLPKYYKADGEPSELTISGRKFLRFSYASPEAGLHWEVLATEIRCHAVQFVFTSRDATMIDALVENLKTIKLIDDGPRCVADYARKENIEYRVDPVFTDNRFNAVPVRFTIGKTGRVQQIHIVSAFEDQAKLVNDALLQWRFKPYVVNGEAVEIETGIVFGAAAVRRRDPNAATVASGQ